MTQTQAAESSLTPVMARRIINRLLDGAAPDEGLEMLTAGRELWLASLRKDLESAKEGDCRIRIFNGRYGDGKTHLMKLFKLLALRESFAVSYVVLTKQTPLNRWDHLYREIVMRMHTAARPGRLGLTSILDPNDPDPAIKDGFAGRAEKIRSVPDLHPDFATAVYRYSTRQGASIDEEQDLLTLKNWLQGQRLSATVLRQFGISESIKRDAGPRMLRSIATCLRYFGLAGIVLLIDEVESTLEQSKTARSEAYENLRLFIDRDNVPSHCIVVTSTTPEMFSEPERGFQSYPALWRRIRDVGASAVNYRGTLVNLAKTPLTADDFLEIGRRIRNVHAIACGWQPESRITDKFLREAAKLAASGRLTLFFSPLAIFVKLVCEELELTEQNPQHAPREDLPKHFQQIDSALRQSHPVEKWD